MGCFTVSTMAYTEDAGDNVATRSNALECLTLCNADPYNTSYGLDAFVSLPVCIISNSNITLHSALLTMTMAYCILK